MRVVYSCILQHHYLRPSLVLGCFLGVYVFSSICGTLLYFFLPIRKLFVRLA